MKAEFATATGLDAAVEADRTQEDSTATLPVAALLPADSPRIGGEDEEHARTLAAIDTPLPPILVHRTTMQVIDGMHRLHAAMLRGQASIEAQLFDGTAEDAFVTAVHANISHGKPLTLAEREAAVERVLRSHPQWSDRAIAHECGLSAKTVAGIRRRASDTTPQLNGRLGRDGRFRPLDGGEGRERAAQYLAAQPNASLRETAQAAGISPATARDVRDRVTRGAEPRLPGQARSSRRKKPVDPAESLLAAARSADSCSNAVASDVALQSTESGADFVAWLEDHSIDNDDWKDFIDIIPLSRVYVVADVARRCAASWAEFGRTLESRVRGGR